MFELFVAFGERGLLLFDYLARTALHRIRDIEHVLQTLVWPCPENGADGILREEVGRWLNAEEE